MTVAETMTAQEAATLLGLSRMRVHQLIKDGTLPALPPNGLEPRLVDAAAVGELAARRRERVCARCGDRFTPRHGATMRCEACRTEGPRRACARCGQPFRAIRSDRRFCSQTCQIAAWDESVAPGTRLTDRELEAAALFAQGLTRREVAERWGVTIAAINDVAGRIRRRMATDDLYAAARLAVLAP